MTLILDQLRLIQFKNYLSGTLELDPGVNVFVGQNGAGKTNVLDAVHYACLTKSYFSIPDKEVPLHGTFQFRIDGHFSRKGDKEHLILKFQSGKKKALERNKVPYTKLAEHVGQFPIVVIAPDDHKLALEGSEVRRRFLDNTLSQMDRVYLGHLMVYNRLLNQRNALLKQFAKEQSYNEALVQTYDEKMAGPAAYIHQQRKLLCEALQGIFTGFYDQLSGAAEVMTFHYKSPLEAFDWLSIQKRNREKDRILQRTCSGVHRDNLEFHLSDRPLKRFASQGQLKSFIIALKLAQFKALSNQLGLIPILLLDDLFDKLDAGRVKRLMQILCQPDFGQVLDR
ncbi:MAG: DNA replication and repair protein RecF, partial [Bacteroidota bacterium]